VEGRRCRQTTIVGAEGGRAPEAMSGIVVVHAPVPGCSAACHGAAARDTLGERPGKRRGPTQLRADPRPVADLCTAVVTSGRAGRWNPFIPPGLPFLKAAAGSHRWTKARAGLSRNSVFSCAAPPKRLSRYGGRHGLDDGLPGRLVRRRSENPPLGRGLSARPRFSNENLDPQGLGRGSR